MQVARSLATYGVRTTGGLDVDTKRRKETTRESRQIYEWGEWKRFKRMRVLSLGIVIRYRGRQAGDIHINTVEDLKIRKEWNVYNDSRSKINTMNVVREWNGYESSRLDVRVDVEHGWGCKA